MDGLCVSLFLFLNGGTNSTYFKMQFVSMPNIALCNCVRNVYVCVDRPSTIMYVHILYAT